jgi:mono/diheme cytochrome c family protein
VTEIPEHLLRRSKERRAALGEGGDAAGASAGGEESAAEPAPAAASSEAAVAAVPATTAAAPAAAVPAVIDEAPSPIFLTEQAVQRTRIPIWAAPVLLLLPFWAILYAGAFGERGSHGPVDPLVLGQQTYVAKCASCHGKAGEGGAGPALASGGAAKTFPDSADQVTWVKEGSSGKDRGTPYGDPNREGGQHKVESGGMPAFGAQLTEEEIQAVVLYEREKL